MDRNQHSTSTRGFASMDQEQQREIARKGGQSVAPENRSFARDHNLAREAGRKGGEASHNTGNRQNTGSSTNNSSNHSSGNFANDRERAAEAGRKGGGSH